MINIPVKPIPDVSIAMATYNGAAYLPEQLDSILHQGFEGFELIIADDASTDNTVSILEEYQKKDSRIKLFFNKENQGYRKSFYTALSHCKGQYILFSDQDDVWFPDKIKSLLEAIGDNLLVFSDSILVDEKNNSLVTKLSDTVHMLQPGTPKVNRGFVIGNCAWGHTILFHRPLLDYINSTEYDHPHDWWFAVVSSQLNKIVYYPRVLNYYRQHSRNLTQAVPLKETRSARIVGRKQSEYETQLARLASIKTLPFNNDRAFYEKWYQLFLKRTSGFSFSLFIFLLLHQRSVFCMKRKHFISKLISIRKMCRKVSG